MIGSIVEKLLDALSMFWQALDYPEQRVVLAVGIYLALVVVGMIYRVFVALVAEDIRQAVTENIPEEPAVSD